MSPGIDAQCKKRERRARHSAHYLKSSLSFGIDTQLTVEALKSVADEVCSEVL